MKKILVISMFCLLLFGIFIFLLAHAENSNSPYQAYIEDSVNVNKITITPRDYQNDVTSTVHDYQIVELDIHAFLKTQPIQVENDAYFIKPVVYELTHNSVKIEYPIIKIFDNQALSDTINQALKNIAFTQEFDENSLKNHRGAMDLSSSYVITQSSEHTFSLLFTIYVSVGGSSGESYEVGFNYDIQNAKEIPLTVADKSIESDAQNEEALYIDSYYFYRLNDYRLNKPTPKEYREQYHFYSEEELRIQKRLPHATLKTIDTASSRNYFILNNTMYYISTIPFGATPQSTYIITNLRAN